MNTQLRRIVRAFYPGRFGDRRSRGNGGRFAWKRFASTVLGVIALIKVALFFFYYNSFVSLQYDVEEAAAQVDTQLQRRKNIILNLSIMVMDYAEHEKEIFKHAADSRKEMAQFRPKAPPEEAGTALSGDGGEKRQALQAGGDLEGLLSKIFAIAERYPDLRLSENFKRYMDALVDTEAKIAEQRMDYNERANDMSTAVGKFPGFVFAKLYGFDAPDFFEPEEEARKPPRVEY